MVCAQIRLYVETSILPLYDNFDAAHRRDHALTVIAESLKLAQHYDVDHDMVYLVAAFHDTGLSQGRERHHIVSGEILLADEFVCERFDAAAREIMREAIEDHRASSNHEPRSIYGKIVAEADRVISVDKTLERTVQYGLKHYPQLDKQGHFARFVAHLDEKYAPGGYLKLWIPHSGNAARLEQLRAVIADGGLLRERFEQIYSQALEQA